MKMIKIFLKRLRHLNKISFLKLLLKKIFFVCTYPSKHRVRRCGCCGRISIYIALGESIEFQRCLRCGANIRYELIAKVLRDILVSLQDSIVVEMDPDSPLRQIIEKSLQVTYKRTFYDSKLPIRSLNSDGAECQDITKLSFPNDFIDLFISSDVMEHVPDLEASLLELNRVIRIGGQYLFTVPMSKKTSRRCFIDASGFLVHIKSPEYHSDPLNPEGILVFWDFGRDMSDYFVRYGFELKSVLESGAYVVWCAKKIKSLNI